VSTKYLPTHLPSLLGSCFEVKEASSPSFWRSRPFAPLKVWIVSKLLSEGINDAGINKNFFSAHHFHSGGATALIRGGVDLKLGHLDLLFAE